MNNKVKFVIITGAFIILAMFGIILMRQDDEVVFNVGDEKTTINICAYVVGEVESPGIFEVPDGTRVYEIIEMAGGATDEAELSRINLAKIVEDEEKITVPKKVAISDDKIVNINSASVDKLSTLNGIGKSTAEKIVKYREENGYFNSIEELMNVSGIGESKYNAIKENIGV